MGYLKRNTCSAGQKTSYRQKDGQESVNLYNTQRPHLSLKYKTPDEVHRALSAEKCQPIAGLVTGRDVTDGVSAFFREIRCQQPVPRAASDGAG